MCSRLPKVLHALGSKPLLAHLLETTFRLQPDQLSMVFNHQQIHKQLDSFNKVNWVPQRESLGTGHAARPGEGVLLLGNP